MFFLHHHFCEKKKKPVSPKNVFYEAVNIISFIKSRYSSTQLFNPLCEEWDVGRKHVCGSPEVQELFREAVLVTELLADMATIFIKHHFCLRE